MIKEDKNYKPTILIVDNSIAITGALKAIVTATSKLRADFNFIYVLPNNSKAIDFIREQNFQVYTLPFLEIRRNVKDLFLYLPILLLNSIRLKKIIQGKQIKIVHMNDFYNLTGVLAKLLGAQVKLITHVRFLPHKFMPSLANFWAKLNIKFANKIICVSDAVKSFFEDSDKILIISDPLPNKEIYEPKNITPVKIDEVKLLYLSNYIRGKGQEYALTAFSEAYKKNNRLRLTFSGGDMGLEKNRLFKAELEQAAIGKGLNKVVKFESFVKDTEKKIKEADILLNFSESESFSLTCLESLFYGTPLIASDCGGPAELFEDKKSGILVPNKDVPQMVNAILELAADVSKQISYSENGKIFVRSKFSPYNTYFKLKSIYIELIKP